MDILVTAEWLLSNVNNVKIFDASTHLPTSDRNAADEFANARIPGAMRFDINLIANQNSDLPHMIPSASEFASSMRMLGINDGDAIVIYDDSPIYPSARAWWMLRLFGHDNVAVLNGGLRAWREAGGAMETTPFDAPAMGNYSTRPPVGAQIIDMAAITAMMNADSVGQIADARPVGRFSGETPEPRAGLRPGHIPGSKNVPLGTLIDESGRYRDASAIRAAFEAGGIDPDRPLIATCGSGVTACGLTLGLALLGNEKVFVFDGSWSEWGLSDAPVETGS